MSPFTSSRLRAAWFQAHKWLGLTLAAAIVPIALSGSALVWHDWLDEILHPQRFAVTAGEPALPVSAYAASAADALGESARIVSIRYPQGEGPVQVTAERPGGAGARPARQLAWLDPGDGRVLDTAGSNDGAVRFLHVLHGRLQIQDGGREIVGWIGVAMLISSLTGLWLWWPVGGGFRRGFRWKRQNAASANLHHQMGFWIALPLAMLSFTGAWISFPSFFGQFEASQPKAGGGPRAPAHPLEATAMTPDAALAAAGAHATGPLVSIAWPTDRAPEWKIGFAREGGTAEVEVADSTGEAAPPAPPRPETLARTMRRWHDGTGMGPAWQIVIFVGGIVPAALAVTGIIMWLRSRGWRAKLKRRRDARASAPAETS